MGVGRAQGRAAMTAILALPRGQQRQQVADCIALLNDWLAKKDAQDAKATADFAVDRSALFASFVASLPDPPVDQTP